MFGTVVNSISKLNSLSAQFTKLKTKTEAKQMENTLICTIFAIEIYKSKVSALRLKRFVVDNRIEIDIYNNPSRYLLSQIVEFLSNLSFNLFLSRELIK